jgi:hypothetical protein
VPRAPVLQDHMISIEWEVRTPHQLNLQLFIEVPLINQENERSCLCVLGMSILAPVFTIYLSIGFGNCSNSVVFFIFYFILTFIL